MINNTRCAEYMRDVNPNKEKSNFANPGQYAILWKLLNQY